MQSKDCVLELRVGQPASLARGEALPPTPSTPPWRGARSYPLPPLLPGYPPPGAGEGHRVDLTD